MTLWHVISAGELKNIFGSLNIYDAGLKTWTDIQQHVCRKSNDKIQPEDLNKIAADVLSDIDPSISKIREKILAYSDKNARGTLIKQSVSAADQRKY